VSNQFCITAVSSKGGVGKTAITTNLLADLGYKTLHTSICSYGWAQSCTKNIITDMVTITINGGGAESGIPDAGPDCFLPPPAFCGNEPTGWRLSFDIVRNFQVISHPMSPAVPYQLVLMVRS